MKRSATVVAGLFLLSAWLARPVAAQSTAPGCGRAVISRVAVAPDGGFSVPSGMDRDFYYGAFAVCSDWCGAY